MEYEFHGEITVNDRFDKEDIVGKAVEEIFKDYDESDIQIITDNVQLSQNYMYYYGSGEQDGMETIEWFFYGSINKIKELFPECSMYAHCCGTIMSSGEECIYTVKLQNRHVRDLDLDCSDGWIRCPDCGEGIVSLGELEFDYDYDCDGCGRHITEEEMNELMSDYINEYDI